MKYVRRRARRRFGVRESRVELVEARRLTRGRRSSPGPGRDPDEEDLADLSTNEERWLRCAACGALVTSPANATSVNGKHEHEFMNPAGIRYVVGCWADAPGAVPFGERSSVWTWFPGFAWQVALCRACHGHLGWSFHAATSFHALIRDRLV